MIRNYSTEMDGKRFCGHNNSTKMNHTVEMSKIIQSETTLSGMRCKPTIELLQKVVDTFMPQQNLAESFDIYLNRINEQKVIEGIICIFPEIELIYFPSKLSSILGTKDKKFHMSKKQNSTNNNTVEKITLETCILILRQFLRAHEYIVKTKSLKRKDTIMRIMTVIPPSHMICSRHDTDSNIIISDSDSDSSEYDD